MTAYLDLSHQLAYAIDVAALVAIVGYGLLAILALRSCVLVTARGRPREAAGPRREAAGPRREAAYELRILQLGRRSLVCPLLAVMRRA